MKGFFNLSLGPNCSYFQTLAQVFLSVCFIFYIVLKIYNAVNVKEQPC